MWGGVCIATRLCHYHHRLKTTKGWALVEGTGKRDFVPPDDPGHPRQATVSNGQSSPERAHPERARAVARGERKNSGGILGEIPP